MEEIQSNNKSLYQDFEGVEIDHITNDGGYKYGKQITLYFKNGKTLNIRAEIDVGNYGIVPKLARNVGSYGVIGSKE